jgi:hypothetical protein
MAKRAKSLMPTEKEIHVNICEYLRMQYPEVLFTSDASGLRVSMGVIMEVKRKSCNYKIPDLLILHRNSQYNGCFIEIKRSASDLYLKSGKLKNDHVKSQEQCLFMLREQGFYAEFGIGYNDTIEKIEKYLNT